MPRTNDNVAPAELAELVKDFETNALGGLLLSIAPVLSEFATKHSRGPRSRLMILGQIVMVTKSAVAQMFDDEMAAAMRKKP